MLALAASVFVLVAAGRPRWKVAAVTALVVTLAIWVCGSGVRLHVRTDEARYVNAGRIGAGLPANAVILSNQHSGSPLLRWRITMRFEWLDPDMACRRSTFRAAESPGVCRSGRLGARDLQVALCGCVRPLLAGPPTASAGRVCWCIYAIPSNRSRSAPLTHLTRIHRDAVAKSAEHAGL